MSPRERSFHVPEELALQQFGGDGGAVDGDEHPVGTRGKIVKRPRDQLLPRPALPRDQDRGVGVGNLPDEGEDLLRRIAHPDEVFQAPPPPDQGTEAHVFPAHGGELEGPVHELGDLVDIERFRDVVKCAQLHRPNGGFDRRVARHEDHLGPGTDLPGVGEHGEPVRPRHDEVGEDHVDGVLIDVPKGFLPGACLVDQEVGAPEHVSKEGERDFLVLGDQERFFHRIQCTESSLPGKVSDPARR